MSSEAISAATFIREYTRELHNKNAAIFAGAGLSMASGYVDWAGLLKELIQDLGLDPEKEHDLVTLAQYHCNQAGGSKTQLTQAIFNHFAPTRTPTKNHQILASLPIYTYWTTNYDKLIEKALEEAKKVPDVKYALKQLSVTRPDRDVVVYKMHGDINNPADAIISKDDYEAYPLKMGAFVSALRGDLVEKTFLFLGFSFTDPNIDYILSRVRVQYEQHARHHYCIQRKVSKKNGESDEEFKYRELKQDYFIRDLKRFSIYTVLVDEYVQITELLASVAVNYKRSSIFISGAAEEYCTWSRTDAEDFVHQLSHQIASKKNRIVTGFGVGVGSAVINGALAYLNDAGKTISDGDIVMRPFPQVATGAVSLDDQWTEYRKAMIDYAGIALFLFGNKRDAKGNVVLSNGMKQEFDLCISTGVHPLPVGATGFMAAELWAEMNGQIDTFYPRATAAFRQEFQRLGDTSILPNDLRATIQRLIDRLQGGMNMAKRVYFAFHYQDVIDFRANVVRNHWCMKPDREDAGFYDASIWEEAKKKGDIALKRLINGGLDNTSNTSVLIGSSTYARPWVRYEILKSFRRGNHLFGVHINSIKAKDQLTKTAGPNPLEYVGVTYSADGQTATLWEKVNGTWIKYDKIDGTADYSTNVSEPYRNQGYHLGNWYKTYDWNSDNGFDNFATWLK